MVKFIELESQYSRAQLVEMARERDISTIGRSKHDIAIDIARYAGELVRGISAYKVPQWPEVKGVFVGGCVKRGIGSSFRAKAHAHNEKWDSYFGWICVRSTKRLGEVEGDVVTKPSQLLWHEYAHILAPGQGHTDPWRRKMRELGQPIPEQYKKKPRPSRDFQMYCNACGHKWISHHNLDRKCPKCGGQALLSHRLRLE